MDTISPPSPRPLSDTQPLLRIEGLVKSFRKTRALDGVSFSVPQGSLTVILGPAGAGKTTALRLIAGLEIANQGSIYLKDRDVTRAEPRDRDVAMIFDTLGLYPDKTGFENIASPLRIRGIKTEIIAPKVEAMAATLKISHVLRREPRTMSGGERQRVALGRALIRDPGLFLLDEPLSSLDALLRIELRAELRRLQRKLDCTFLMTTPDFAEAMAVADQVIMLRQGRIVQIAPPQTLYDRPIDRETARFIGAPEINLLPASALPANNGMIRFAGASFMASSVLAAPLPQGCDLFEIGIRPEHLILTDPATAPIQGQLIDTEPLGLESALTVRAADGAALRLVASAEKARSLTIGDPVGLSLSGPHLLAFDAATGVRFA